MDFSQQLHTALMNKIRQTENVAYSGKTNTTDDRLYFTIIWQGSYEIIPIQFVPDVLNYNRAANYNNVEVMTRNIPKPKFTGGATTLNFQLDFFAEMDDRSDVINRVRKLEALTYTDGYNKPVALVKLIWGKGLFRNQTWIITSVGVKLTDFKPANGFLPQQAYVDVTLQQVSDKNLVWEDITREITGIESPKITQYPTRNDKLDNANAAAYIISKLSERL